MDDRSEHDEYDPVDGPGRHGWCSISRGRLDSVYIFSISSGGGSLFCPCETARRDGSEQADGISRNVGKNTGWAGGLVSRWQGDRVSSI